MCLVSRKLVFCRTAINTKATKNRVSCMVLGTAIWKTQIWVKPRVYREEKQSKVYKGKRHMTVKVTRVMTDSDASLSAPFYRAFLAISIPP